MNRFGEIVVGVLVVLILAAILFPVFTQTKGGKKPSCYSHVRQLGTGLVMYAGDAEERFPLRDGWMDSVEKYVRNPDAFHCTAMPKGTFGYAFNGGLSGAEGPKEPASTLLVYDSVNPIRNASDLGTSLPATGRHDKRNFVSYADGHARSVLMPAVVQ